MSSIRTLYTRMAHLKDLVLVHAILVTLICVCSTVSSVANVENVENVTYISSVGVCSLPDHLPYVL